MQLVRLIGVVAPSLLIVGILVMFVGFGGWALLMDLRQSGEDTGLVLFGLALYLGIAAWLGSAFLRFGVRLLPVASSGRRRTGLICVLVFALSLLVAPFVVFAVELVTTFEFLSSNIPLSPGGEFDFKGLGETLELFVFIFGTWSLISLGAPLVLLLFRHLGPTSWHRRPYLLFLRRFTGLSNAVGIGPLVRGVPAGTRVVFLVGPRDNPRIWNPFMMAFAGIRPARPLYSVPICLQSTEDSWKDDVRAFAANASAIVVDLTDDSKSMKFERDVAESSGRPESVLWLYDQSAEQPVLPAVGKRVPYETSRWRALPATLVMFLFAAYLTLGVIVLLPLPTLTEDDSRLLRYSYAAGMLGVAIAAGIAVAIRYAWHPRLKSRSRRRIRAVVSELFESS